MWEISEPYRELDFDEQVGFLRHRFCGVLQRGCNRLWEQGKKACQFVFVFEGSLPERGKSEPGELTLRIAEHMVEWMMNPPVVVLTAESASLERVAGELDRTRETLLLAHLGTLREVREIPGAWDLVRHKGAWVNKPEEPW